MTGARRLLLIDYHFGTPGATGGARWRAMAAHLAAEGWRFDVITRGAADAVASNSEQDFEGIRVFRVAAPTVVDDAVAALGRVRRRLRGRGGGDAPSVPAAVAAVSPAAASATGGLYARFAAAVNAVRITAPEWGWTRRAARLGRELARRERYWAVVVSSPPHLTQRAGAALSRATDIPYVADFRDPWVFGRPEKYDVSLLASPLGRVFEGPTLRRAALVLCNTQHAQRAVTMIYPALAGKAVAVPNGYDADDRVPGQPDTRRFRVVFTGWLYPNMDPECVLAAVGRLRRRASLGPDQLAVEFMGCAETHGGVSLGAMAARHGLDECFRLFAAAPRAEARRLQAAAAVLVAFDASTQLAMPTKFYDYAQMGGTMLLIGFPDGAMAAAAAQLGLRVCAPDDAAGLDAALDDAVRRWRSRELVAPLDRGGLFDRRLQSERVQELLLALSAR